MEAPHWTTLCGLLVLALQPSLPALADADDSLQPRITLVADHSNDPVLGIVGTGAVQFVETPAAPVPRECKPKYMAGPGMGIALGPSAIVGGMYAVAAGAVLNDDKSTKDKGLIATGSFLMAGGLATLLYSIGKLVSNRRERRRVCDSDTPQSK